MALEGAAYQGWTDGFRGNLNIGSHADLAMLNADPEHASSDALAGIAVTQTWLKGARVC
jgi:predicted amidohydrolase YtcJ